MPVNIKGSSSGSVTLAAPASGSDVTVTLPGTSMDLGSELAAKAALAGATFTGVVAVPLGSATAPSIVPTGDTNTGIYSPGADQLSVSTGGTERMRIDNAGNVGIGDTTNSAYKMLVRAPDSGNSNYALVVASTTANLFFVRNDGVIYAPPTYAQTVGATNRDLYIDNNGLVGYVSSIRASKTDITPQADPSWLLDLEPVTFRYRAKNEDGTYSDQPDGPVQYGLIAEDVEAVNRDVVFYDDTDNGPELRGVAYSALITPLLALVQQQQAQIDALTARVAALESA